MNTQTERAFGGRTMIGLAVLAVALAAAPWGCAIPKSAPSLGVGLRRSSYGLPAKNADHAWWAANARRFASRFPGAAPMIVEIVCRPSTDTPVCGS